MSRSIVAEFLGTLFLIMIVVGSGIMGETLAQGNAAIALLANSLATGAGLYVLIQCLGPISGAHFNPVVSFAEMLDKRLEIRPMLSFWIAQISGGIFGIFLTHIMFGLSILQVASKNRNSFPLCISEFIATFGLLMAIALTKKQCLETVATTVALYITAAYWFTSSTSFANPAVTIARAWSDSFAGISPEGIIPFVVAQFLGAALAWILQAQLKVT